MNKTFDLFKAHILENNRWKKLINPTVKRGKTALPLRSVDQEEIGIRLDYDGEITLDGANFHKYEMQPNAGSKLPKTIKDWMNKNKGTHSVMANVFIKKDSSSKEEVMSAVERAIKIFRDKCKP